MTIGDSVEGISITGATGSSKTSGSGATIARAMLECGYGGMVCSMKAEEKSLWQKYCRETGREQDFLAFGPSQPWRFDYLAAELAREGPGAGRVENVVNLFSTVMEVAERNSGGAKGREDEGFFKRACRQLIRAAADLSIAATGTVSLPTLHEIVISAPTSRAEFKSEAWRSESLCYRYLVEAEKRPMSPHQRRDFDIVAAYFCIEYPSMADKTRSNIVSTFTSLADVMLRGDLRTLFCEETNLSPKVLEDGKVIFLDMPVKEYADLGQIAQVVMKYAFFQRHMERRNTATSLRPVFLWIDEAQGFVTSYDQQFQCTCRSARVATVLLSQNLPNYHAALGGGDKARAETASLLANLNTKILHANSCSTTNEWASNMIGRKVQTFFNGNTSRGDEDWIPAALGIGQAGHTSAGFSETMELEIEPAAFSTLRTGGARNQGCAEAIVFQNGRTFQASGRTWLPVTFIQDGFAPPGRSRHGS